MTVLRSRHLVPAFSLLLGVVMGAAALHGGSSAGTALGLMMLSTATQAMKISVCTIDWTSRVASATNRPIVGSSAATGVLGVTWSDI